MSKIGAGLATVGVWASVAAIAYFTKSASDAIFGGVSATLVIWVWS